jgi:hypothetical protein
MDMHRFPRFEHKSEPLLPRHAFLRRLGRCGLLGAALVALSLAIGMLGYHGFENLSWIDAFLNSAMLIGGMGPVNTPVTSAGKLFAGLYALYCGLLVVLVAGIILAPVAHRLLHRFHVEGRT